MDRRPWMFFALVAGLVLAADLLTKSWALGALEPGASTRYAFGILPLTLHFNTGGLWGLGGGVVSRWFFPVATAVALFVLVQLYRSTTPDHRLRRILVPAIAGGALGNLVDRLRWDRGVVDFLGPFDLGFMVWPIFNVADMAISCGTALLVLSLWREPAPEPSPAAAGEAETPAPNSP